MLGVFGQLAQSFMLIGAIGFGGGLAMLAPIEYEVVVRRGWTTPEKFANMVALSEMTPGPIAINAATYLGYTSVMSPAAPTPGEAEGAARADGPGGTDGRGAEPTPALSWPWGLAGGMAATLAVCLPPFAMMCAASMVFARVRQQPRIKRLMADLRPVVIGFIAAAAWKIFAQPSTFTGWLGYAVFPAVLGLSLWKSWHPAWLLLGAGIAGFLWGQAG